MQRYFATRNKNQIILGDGDVHHLLHVMRARINDEIEAVIEGKLYSGIIKSLNPLNIEINYEIPLDSELPCPVTLFFALAKGDKIEFVIQKATELGVSRIVLVKTERCVTKFSDEDFRRKLERFNKISKEASEQSHRLVIPEIVVKENMIPIFENCMNSLNVNAPKEYSLCPCSDICNPSRLTIFPRCFLQEMVFTVLLKIQTGISCSRSFSGLTAGSIMDLSMQALWLVLSPACS